MTNREALLTVVQLSTYLGVPVRTIYRWRSRGEGPPGYRVGKHVRYSITEVERWLASRADTER